MNSVTILVDGRAPEGAKETLKSMGNIVEIRSVGVVYDAISGHPDIFFCQSGSHLFTAPNTPDVIVRQLQELGVGLIMGEESLGMNYPQSAKYNALVTPEHLIHNFRYSDMSLSRNLPDHHPVHVSQGYTRCNLIHLGHDHYITSDQGIYRSLTGLSFDVLMVDPLSIKLPGFKHGFFGGACGLYKDEIILMGSLKHHPEGDTIRSFIDQQGLKINELYDGPLLDTGSLLFVEN